MTSTSAPVIVLRRASKSYGDVRALDDVTLTVPPGQIYALLGLNGAGKTTLIRMLLGMVRPTAGSVSVLGHSVTARPDWSAVGYLVESPAAYPELTVRENLEVVRRLRKLTDPGAVGDVVTLFGLERYVDRRAGTLSLGNLQRLGLAKAMIHRPSLLILDEPVNGLDPAGVAEVRTLLERLAREHGTTVFLSSHLLGEVGRLATRVGVLHDGRLVTEFDATSLGSRVARALQVVTRDDTRAAELLRTGGFAVEPHEGRLVLDARAADHPEEVASLLVHAGIPLTHLAVVEEDLEAYFLRLVGASPDPEPHRSEELTRVG